MKKVMMIVLLIMFAVHLSDEVAFAQGPRGASPGVRGVPAQAQDRVSPRSASADEGSNGRTAPETKAANSLERNPELAARLETMLPANVTLQDAAAGFKNHGQFIAALHVSQNLNIPFGDLKAAMTGEDSKSLGEAIQQVLPTISEAQATTEARKAEGQAKATEKGARN